mgnify:CR=1 FL=1
MDCDRLTVHGSQGRRLQRSSRSLDVGVRTMDSEDMIKVGKTVSILAHVKENHVGYLLGLLVLHSTGLLVSLQSNVGACIP